MDAEADALDEMLGQPDPIGIGGGDGGDVDGGVSVSTDDSADGTVLQMIATSEDVDLAQRSPLIRHEEHTRLKLALIDRKREVLLGLRGSGTVDDIVVRRISARLDLEQVRLQGIEDYD